MDTIGRRMQRVGVPTLLVLGLLATAVPAAAEDPSEGVWSVEAQSHVESGMSHGQEWVRTNPMLISALSATMGAPPQHVVDDYYGSFGATTTMLWQDGPAEVAGWQPGGTANDFVTWLRDDGTSSVWNPFLSVFESTGQVVGGLGFNHPGRVAYQVGDEAGSITALDHIQSGFDAVRTVDPEALVYTNLSYYVTDRDAVLGHWQNSIDADVLMMSDYFFNGLHYTAMEEMRSRALAKG
ncbi:MAG: hypothetical protein ACR2N7_05735, partial [Acidimicrobiia bacterium]